MNCSNCGATLRSGATRCIKCGSLVESPAPSPAPSTHQQAGQTGTAVPMAQPAPAQPYQPQPYQPQAYTPQPAYYPQVNVPSEKSKIVAGLLGLFLGTLGIHNFYLGRIVRGVFQIVLTCTCYGVMITSPWAFIESIIILCGNARDGNGRPVTN